MSRDLVIDDSDGAVTRQLAAADCTATDLHPFGAEATGEIEALDILEVVDARHPASIAPMAIAQDPRRPAYPSLEASPLQLTRAAGVPVLSENAIVATALVLALCLVAGVGGVLLGSHGSRAAFAPTDRRAPRAALVLEAREEVTQPPLTAPAKDRDDPATPVAPVAVVATHRDGPRGTGVLHVVGSVTGALVDGIPHRVLDGAVTLACGHHRVKLPGRSVRNVNVPCGGSTTF